MFLRLYESVAECTSPLVELKIEQNLSLKVEAKAAMLGLLIKFQIILFLCVIPKISRHRDTDFFH